MRAGLLAALTVLACGRPSRPPASTGGHASAGKVIIEHAVVPAPITPAEASGFLVLRNQAPAPDTLLGVTTPDADTVMLHGMSGNQMEPVAFIALPAQGEVRLEPGRFHLMMHDLRRPLAIGDTVALTLHLARNGSVTVAAPVLRYTEAVEAVAEPPR